MFNEDLPLHSRQHSIKFGDIVSGSNIAEYSFVMTRIGNFKDRANKNLNRALDRLRASTGKLVINAVWLDTIEVRDGEVYYVRMVKFQLQEKLTLKVVES